MCCVVFVSSFAVLKTEVVGCWQKSKKLFL